MALVGRHREQQALAELLAATRRGQGGVVVLRGEAGIGKTALLANLVEGASGVRVLQISGAETELELAYAGVQQLCTPVMGLIGRLPGPQADALQVALGRKAGVAPDRLLVGLAVLTLLGEAGAAAPVLCVIDDAQWVDSASMQALALVARRILADPVAMVFATRDSGADQTLAGHPELVLRGLADHEARLLLASVVPGRINDRVRETVLSEAAGNPLALLELHKALTRDDWPAATGFRTLRRRRRRSSAPSSGRSKGCPPTRDSYCWWLLPSRWADRNGSGRPPTDWASAGRRSRRRRPPA